MTSLRHNPVERAREPRDAYLDAARDCILDVGWRRTTLTEVARRAGRLADDDLPHLGRHADPARRPDDPRVGRRRRRSRSPTAAPPSSASATRSSAPSGSCAHNELFVRIVELDPELILPYLFSRRGRSQELILALTAEAIAEGQQAAGDPPRQPGRHRAGAAAGRPRVRAVGAHDGRRGRLRAGARRRARHPDHPDAAAMTAMTPPAADHARPGRRPHRGRRRRHRPRHHRRRRRPRRRHPRPVRAGRRRPRPGLRHVALVVQARARRAALPRLRPGRRGPRERGRARHPDGGHRSAPHPRHADADAAQRQPSPGSRPASIRGGDCSAATCCAAAPAPARDTLPRPRHLSATEALQLAPPLRKAGLRGAMLGWDGQLEDDARLVDHGRAHRRVVRRPRAHPRPGPEATGTSVALRDELTGAAPRGHRPHGRQRHRRLGRRPGRRGPAAPQPRHPPGAARRDAARPAGRGLRAGPGRDQPVRAGPPPARRHRLRRPHRRARRRAGARRAGADRARDRLPARRRARRRSSGRCTAPTWSAPTPGCGRCSTPGRA